MNGGGGKLMQSFTYPFQSLGLKRVFVPSHYPLAGNNTAFHHSCMLLAGSYDLQFIPSIFNNEL